ncbi:hypothetical protein [Brevibacterium aurantiacum]|uniref:hypothetical protein n=1 Tax=Brevibacterium aurantiacum TaxID=273384 RepID=UPI0018665411|nr:hypothetical protein [Brevibacterium aurantiacum]
MFTNNSPQSNASRLDDERRDIAILGDVDARMLNRMAKRNRGRNPFEVSGDAIAVQREAGDR